MKTTKNRFFIISLTLLVVALVTWGQVLVQKNEHLIGGGINRTFLFLLINVHVAIITVLLFLIVRSSIKLIVERRQQVPGSLFKRNLLFVFILFSVISAFFVFFTAGKFITRSVDRWFQTHLTKGFESAQDLHRQHTLPARKDIARVGQLLTPDRVAGCQGEVRRDAMMLAARYPELAIYGLYILDVADTMLRRFLRDEVAVWRSYRPYNDRTMKSLCRQFMTRIHYTSGHEGIFDFYGSLYWVKVIAGRRCILIHRYPENIRQPLIQLESAANDYEQLYSMRWSVYVNYAVSFILITLLILFLAVWCAFYLARGISRPIQELSDAANRLGQGDWDCRVPENPTSDLQTLARAFNKMLGAVQDAHASLDQKNKELIEIVQHISSAVFLVNRWGKIVFCNSAGERIVSQQAALDGLAGKKVRVLGRILCEKFFAMARELNKKADGHLVQEMTIDVPSGQRMYMVYATVFSSIARQQNGVLIVLDDMTDVVKMSRLKHGKRRQSRWRMRLKIH